MSRSKVLEVLAWLGGGMLALIVYFSDPTTNAELAAFILSLLSLAIGIWIFWTHGEGRITAGGVWGLAFALFVGFAGIYLLDESAGDGRELLHALAVAYFGQVLMYGFFWNRRLDMAAGVRWPIDPAVTRWAIWLGTAVLLGSTLVAARGGKASTLVEPAAFSSAVLLAAALLVRRGMRQELWRVCLAACAFLAYSLFVFSGFGRLTIGTLGLAICLLACKRFPGRSVKVVILVVSVPTLLLLARTRVEFTSELNPDQLPSVSGFESVVGPLESFGELLARREQLPLGWGSTFWASAVALFPGSLWEGKPAGFGTVLVPILSPELVGTGHSEAALSQGEWLFDFGLIGLAVMIPVLGLLVRWADVWLEAANSRPVTSRRTLLVLVAATIIAAGFVDLVWVGTFTYVARTGSRLLILGLFSAIAPFTLSNRRRGRDGLSLDLL